MREWIVTWLQVVGVLLGIGVVAAALVAPIIITDLVWGAYPAVVVTLVWLLILLTVGVTVWIVHERRIEREREAEEAAREVEWRALMAEQEARRTAWRTPR